MCKFLLAVRWVLKFHFPCFVYFCSLLEQDVEEMFLLSFNCVVHVLSLPSADDQGLESSGLWWNQRPTLHAGASSTVFGNVETEPHIKDLNLIMKDCSAF